MTDYEMIRNKEEHTVSKAVPKVEVGDYLKISKQFFKIVMIVSEPAKYWWFNKRKYWFDLDDGRTVTFTDSQYVNVIPKEIAKQISFSKNRIPIFHTV